MINNNDYDRILYDKIFHYLWAQVMHSQLQSQIKSDTQDPPKISIPETIIIIRSHPIHWFFYDQVQGKIMKKKRDNLDQKNWKKWGGCIFASFLVFFKHNKKYQRQKDVWNRVDSGDFQNLEIEYFDQPAFKAFMDNTQRNISYGILQRFMEHGEDYNCLTSNIFKILSKHQSKLYGVERLLYLPKEQIESLYRNLKSTYMKGVVLLMDLNISVKHVIKKQTQSVGQVKDYQSKRIQILIEQMIDHIESISFGQLKITVGTFYFKLDIQNNFHFLFCTNISFDESARQLRKNIKGNDPSSFLNSIQIPQRVDMIMSSYESRPLQIERDSRCMRCLKMEVNCKIKFMPYQYIIEEKDKLGKIYKPKEWLELTQNDKESRQIQPQNYVPKQLQIFCKKGNQNKVFLDNNLQLPLLLQMIHSNLKQTDYQKLKESFSFQNMLIPMCEECYIELISIWESDIQQTQDKNEFHLFAEKQKFLPKFQEYRVQFLNIQRKAHVNINSLFFFFIKEILNEKVKPKNKYSMLSYRIKSGQMNKQFLKKTDESQQQSLSGTQCLSNKNAHLSQTLASTRQTFSYIRPSTTVDSHKKQINMSPLAKSARAIKYLSKNQEHSKNRAYKLAHQTITVSSYLNDTNSEKNLLANPKSQ